MLSVVVASWALRPESRRLDRASESRAGRELDTAAPSPVI
jgi:hypothetical protein